MYKSILFWNRMFHQGNTSTKHKKSTNGFLAPKDQQPHPNSCPNPLLCPVSYPPPHIPLSAMNTRQSGLKKFTTTVHSCHSCWRHRPSFRACYAAPRPTHREKGWKPHWKWRMHPREESPHRNKREPLANLALGLGHSHIHIWGRLRQGSHQG